MTTSIEDDIKARLKELAQAGKEAEIAQSKREEDYLKDCEKLTELAIAAGVPKSAIVKSSYNSSREPYLDFTVADVPISLQSNGHIVSLLIIGAAPITFDVDADKTQVRAAIVDYVARYKAAVESAIDRAPKYGDR